MRRIGDHDFDFVGQILPQKDNKGAILEYTHSLPDNIRPNRHASGPFCTFRPVSFPEEPGVYVITVGDNPVYAGECENLSRRFGPEGYGHISKRNCHFDGQSTNCKVNSRILQEFWKGDLVGLWFFRTTDHKIVEDDVVRKINPPWNNKCDRTIVPRLKSENVMGASPKTESFRMALMDIFKTATLEGKTSVVIRASDLHRMVGGYPPKRGESHRMPVCCDVMRSFMDVSVGDRVLCSPPKKRGASLEIEYKLPRLGRQS